MIHVDAVTVTFGRTIALDGVDAELPSGITGLFGQNASGKTTLLRVIAGLLTPTEGRVTIDGIAVAGADEDMRRRIGYAGHASGLYTRLTVAENLALFARLTGAPRNRVDGSLRALGLEAHRDTLVATLSAGFKRRAAVARALVHDPDVLLLDEPYANLDDDAAVQLSAAIQGWARPGKAAVIATHGAKRVKSYAHAGLILQRGKVAVFGEYRTAKVAR